MFFKKDSGLKNKSKYTYLTIILDENSTCMPVNDNYEMSNLFNHYFFQQTQVNDNNTELPTIAIDHNDSQCTLEILL